MDLVSNAISGNLIRKMDFEQLQNFHNILTLRYTPSKDFLLPKLDYADFSLKIKDNYEQRTEFFLKDSIQKYIYTNNPKNICVALSGGVDSILTSTLVREIFPELEINAISFGFDEKDSDIKKASEISQKLNLNFESVIFTNFLNNLPKQISIIKEPKINYYWYDVAKKAKEKSDFLFTGDGSDELFAGYTFRYSKFLEISPQPSWRDKVRAYLECHNRDWVPDQDQIFAKKINFSWEKIYEILRPYFDNDLQPLEQVLLADYMGKLMFDWMPSYKKIYSHLNLHGFSPMLSMDLIKYSTSIPIEKKYNITTNVGKLILRKILKNKGITTETAKKGFSPNLPMFWDLYGKEISSTYLKDARIIRDDFISQNWVFSALNRINEYSDVRYINRILHIISFEIWYRLFVTQEMTSTDKLL